MTMVLLFYTYLITACAFATVIGGEAERWGSAIFIVALVATSIVAWSTTWVGSEWPLAGVDLVCFLALFALAVYSGRYWPIWAAGFQLIAVLTHVAVYFAAPLPAVYRAMETVWGVPAIGVMVIGALLDRSAGIGGHGYERDAPLDSRRARRDG